MISISKDNRMFIWNLLNSKKAYQRRFGINLHKVKIFNEDVIILLSDKLVSIFKTSENKEIKRLEHNKKLNDLLVWKQFLFVGDDEGYIFIYQIDAEN